MREFEVDLTGVRSLNGFLAAFNSGFCRHVGGELRSLNWATFNDYLSWPDDDRYRLVFRGWGRIRGVHRRLVLECVADNPQVEVVIAEPLYVPD